MPKDELRDTASRKAAKLLMNAYQRQRKKSWAALARRYDLSKVRCYRIAHGTLKLNPSRDTCLIRAIVRECDAVTRPVTLRRLIRRVGIPFLERRQPSSTGRYGAGGRPVTEKG